MIHFRDFCIPTEPDFDSQFYGTAYAQYVQTFYVEYCKTHQIPEARRLYFHFYLYGRDSGFCKNDGTVNHQIDVTSETHLWLLLEHLLIELAGKNPAASQDLILRVQAVSQFEPWKSCPIVAKTLSAVTESLNVLQTVDSAIDLSWGSLAEFIALSKTPLDVQQDFVKVDCQHSKSFKLLPRKSHDDRKFRLVAQQAFAHHRSGWSYVIKHGLAALHNQNATVVLDGFLDHSLLWPPPAFRRLCFTNPWTGFLHNPPIGFNYYFQGYDSSNISLLTSKLFQQIKHNCLGIFTLSKPHADYVKSLQPTLCVEHLHHPTEIPARKFDCTSFLNNADKKVVSLGWWLRKQRSFYELQTSQYAKCKIDSSHNAEHLNRVLQFEEQIFGKLSAEQRNSVAALPRLNNEQYDELLAHNVVFLDLYDATANNAIIECIARGTPVLVNPLPSIKYYLGEEYPFYFTTLEEAAAKLEDYPLVCQTHEYLMNFTGRQNITIETFLERLQNSEIYQKASGL